MKISIASLGFCARSASHITHTLNRRKHTEKTDSVHRHFVDTGSTGFCCVDAMSIENETRHRPPGAVHRSQSTSTLREQYVNFVLFFKFTWTIFELNFILWIDFHLISSTSIVKKFSRHNQLLLIWNFDSAIRWGGLFYFIMEHYLPRHGELEARGGNWQQQ
jgi:hypothetical protein